ncbi:MAG: hypothetical protein IJY23_08770 [Clostridia bacterium]|nr:hypothetical protein [Clostridia bacterium]
MGDFIDFFKGVLAGEFDFYAFVGRFGHLLNEAGFAAVFEKIESFGMISAIVAIALGAILIFYGKKYLGLLSLVASTAVGYFAGASLMHPMLIGTLPVLEGKEFICGAIVALVGAVLNKLIYNVLFYGLAAVFSYVICFVNGLIPVALPTTGNATMSYIAVGAVIVILLLQRKSAQRLGTAFLGAFLVTYGVKFFFDYTALLPEYAVWINAGVMCVIAAIGFAYQYKRRRRY